MTRRFSGLADKAADQMTESECRAEYRAIRARSGMAPRYFDDLAGALIEDRSEADCAQWIRAARRVSQRCPKCNGSGRYGWGAFVNGRPSHSGPCFACQGRGVLTDADIRRNWGYWTHYVRISL